jgi:hypothetical protein
VGAGGGDQGIEREQVEGEPAQQQQLHGCRQPRAGRSGSAGHAARVARQEEARVCYMPSSCQANVFLCLWQTQSVVAKTTVDTLAIKALNGCQPDPQTHWYRQLTYHGDQEGPAAVPLPVKVHALPHTEQHRRHCSSRGAGCELLAPRCFALTGCLTGQACAKHASKSPQRILSHDVRMERLQ